MSTGGRAVQVGIDAAERVLCAGDILSTWETAESGGAAPRPRPRPLPLPRGLPGRRLAALDSAFEGPAVGCSSSPPVGMGEPIDVANDLFSASTNVIELPEVRR